MKTTFIAFIALLLVAGTLGGRITAWGDIEVYYPNKGQISTMDLFVTLDNKLPIGHYMRITLPFSASPSISATIYSGATSKGTFFAAPGTPTGTSAGTVTVAKQVTTAPFHNYLTFSADLAAATNYVIRVTFSTSPSDAGFLGYVQLETMSPAYSLTGSGNGFTTDIPITYDVNNAFAPVHIGAAPNTLTLTSTADTNANVAGASSVRQFKITTTANFYYWPTIVLSWGSSSFTVSNLTSIDTGVNATLPTPLTSGTGANQFSYSTSGNSLVILHNAVLTANTPITYNVTIANPSSQISTTFSAMIYHRYNYNLTDITGTNISVSITSGGTTSTASTAVAINAQQVLLSWGVDRNISAFQSTATAKTFALYSSALTNPTFQGVNFMFGLNTSISNSAGYRVQIGICAAIANCDVLENSIVSNITGASCAVVYGTGVSIYCNVTSLATTGNSIAARVFLLGAAGGAGVMTGTLTGGYTMNDTTFGVINIYIGQTNTTFNATTTSGQAASPYNAITFNTAPLVNLNGNGPLVAMPASATTPNGGSTAYPSLWAGVSGASFPVLVSNTTSNYTAWPAVNSANAGLYGGIFTSPTAGTKYNLALFTTATILNLANSWSTFSVGTGTAPVAAATTYAFTSGNPGLDLFFNPNVFGAAGTSATNAIAKCFANNLPVSINPPISSAQTEVAGVATGTVNGKLTAHCFQTTVTNAYVRLRFLPVFSATNNGIAAAAGDAKVINFDSVVATPTFLSFFWESGISITNGYTGSSIRADSNIPDFYGIFYTLIFTTQPLTTGSGSPVDAGELSASMTGLNTASGSFTLGFPIFWNQMLLGPYAAYTSGQTTAVPYYNSKAVFLSNVDNNGDAFVTSANAVYLLRVRGYFNTTSTGPDVNLVPTGGRVALFLQIAAGQSSWDGLGGAGFTTGSTANSYATSTSAAIGATTLAGNGAIRCWSNNAIGNCTQDRRGRPLATANSPNLGFVTTLDFYQIFTSDANYSANFSMAILLKPIIPAVGVFNAMKYRFGFQLNNLFYIQSFDQLYDNGAALANGIYTPIAVPFATAAGATAAPYTTATNCTIPYAQATGSGVRIVPGASDTDNSVVNGTVSVNSLAGVTVSKRQGAVTWCLPWNFKAASAFAITAASFENSTLGDRCVAFDYLAATNSVFYCLFCPVASTTNLPAAAGAALNITLTSMTTGTATQILGQSNTMIAGDTGLLVDLGVCLNVNGPGAVANSTNPYHWLANTITGISSSGSAYNLSGQKVTISFVAASGLTYAVADSVTLTGRTALTNVSDTNFPYGTIDSSNYVCKVVPTASATNFTAMSTCTAAISSGVLTFTMPSTPASSQITNTATGWTIILWGLNGNLSAASPVTTANFYMQTLKSSVIVDSSNTTNTSLASWVLNTAAVLNFTTGNVGYQRQIIGARGWFKFDFAFTSRNWYTNDKIVLSVDGVVTSTVNANTSVVKCRITDTADVIQQGFQSCTLAPSTTPATLTIYALPASYASGNFDFSAGNGFRVYLDNMVTLTPQTNKAIYGSIYFNNGSTASLTKNTTGTDIAAQNLTTAQSMATGSSLTKFFAAANDYTDIVLTLTSASALSTSSRITVAFPSYYNPGIVGHANAIYCTINGVYAMCANGVVSALGAVTSIEQGSRTVAVWGISSSVNANTSFVLKIGGVRAPPAAYVAETFYVQINTDNSETLTTISSAVSITDQAYVAQTVLPMNVVWSTIGAATTRTLTTFTWTIGFNTTGVTSLNTSQVIAAYFPEHMGLAWGLFAPTCTVIDATNTSLVYASTQNIVGNQVFLNISTAIPTAAVVIFTCNNVRTIDNDGVYLGNSDVTFRVVDANGTNVYQRSIPGFHNVNYNYAMKATLTYLNWNSSTSFSSLSSPRPLTAGTYSLQIAATVATASNRTFTITPSNTNFGFLSTAAPFYLTTGAVSNTTLLGCSSSVTVGIYAISFNISDTTLYTTMPHLFIAVNNIPQTIAQSATTISTYWIASTTTSSFAPLTFDASSIPPYSDITITPVAPTGNTNFTFTPAFIKLTAASPKNYFVFSTTSATAAATATAAYTFTVSGTNAASYATPSAVTLSLASDATGTNTGTPNFTITADTTDQSSATAKVLTVTLTGVTQATIYWAVALKGQAITDATAIQTGAALWTQYGSSAAVFSQYGANTANLAQYGQFYQTTSPSKSPSNFALGNLFAGTGYTLTAVAVSLANKTSNVFSFDFMTGSNGFAMQRWLYNYTTYPSAAQRQTLLCSISQMLAVPAWTVRDVNGEICGNTTAFYNATNSTGDLGVYFYPLQTNTETVMTLLQTNLNATAKNTLLNTTVAGTTGGLGYMLQPMLDVTIKNAQVGTTFPSSGTVGQTWASFSGLALNDTGFIFMAVGSNTTTAPTAVAFKQAAAGINTNTGLSQIQVLYYYPGGGSLSYNFTGFTAGTTYNCFLMAGNNDPSFLQNMTSVTTVPFTTSTTSTGTTGSPIGVVFSVMALFASVISLMFF